MSNRHPICTASARHYAEAYATHYTRRDLLGAPQAYDQVIELHPNPPEAGYSRSQMRNILNLVVPAEEPIASQVALAVDSWSESTMSRPPLSRPELQPRFGNILATTSGRFRAPQSSLVLTVHEDGLAA